MIAREMLKTKETHLSPALHLLLACQRLALGRVKELGLPDTPACRHLTPNEPLVSFSLSLSHNKLSKILRELKLFLLYSDGLK